MFLGAETSSSHPLFRHMQICSTEVISGYLFLKLLPCLHKRSIPATLRQLSMGLSGSSTATLGGSPQKQQRSWSEKCKTYNKRPGFKETGLLCDPGMSYFCNLIFSSFVSFIKTKKTCCVAQAGCLLASTSQVLGFLTYSNTMPGSLNSYDSLSHKRVYQEISKLKATPHP